MKHLILAAFILALALMANAQTTKSAQLVQISGKVFTDLIEGNARFVADKTGTPDIKNRFSPS